MNQEWEVPKLEYVVLERVTLVGRGWRSRRRVREGGTGQRWWVMGGGHEDGREAPCICTCGATPNTNPPLKLRGGQLPTGSDRLLEGWLSRLIRPAEWPKDAPMAWSLGLRAGRLLLCTKAHVTCQVSGCLRWDVLGRRAWGDEPHVSPTSRLVGDMGTKRLLNMEQILGESGI